MKFIHDSANKLEFFDSDLSNSLPCQLLSFRSIFKEKLQNEHQSKQLLNYLF